MLNNIFASLLNLVIVVNGVENTKTVDVIPTIETCDLDIAAAEIFDDAPADIILSRENSIQLCKIVLYGWWCWMNGETSQTCCEKEVQASGPTSCCTNANGRVDCYSIPKQKE